MINRFALFAPMAALLLLCGCSQQSAQNASNDVSHGIVTVNDEAKKIGAEAKPAINKISVEAKPALQKLDLGARVTTALRANANLPDTIRVDASTDGVRLRGTVQNAGQKILAGKIAKETVPAGKSVRNELTVKAG